MYRAQIRHVLTPTCASIAHAGLIDPFSAPARWRVQLSICCTDNHVCHLTPSRKRESYCGATRSISEFTKRTEVSFWRRRRDMKQGIGRCSGTRRSVLWLPEHPLYIYVFVK